MSNLVGQEGSFDYPGFDYAPQRTRIARKLALAQALQKQGLEPLQTDRMAGGWAIPISPFEGLAKLAQTYVGAKTGSGVEKDQADLAKTAQGDYAKALSTALKGSGLEQNDIDALTAAGSNPMAAAQMPMITGIMQQKRQMKMLQDWLANGGQGVPGQTPAAPAGPQVGQGTVLSPDAPQPAQGGGTPQGGGGLGNLPVGAQNVLGGAMLGIPGLTEIGKLQHSDSQTRGGVQYDQQGNAFIINNNGQPQYLPGISARDKPELVNQGGVQQFRDPYTGLPVGQPIQQGLTPEQQQTIPLKQLDTALGAQKQQFETGLPTPKVGQPIPSAAKPIQGGQTIPQGVQGQQAVPPVGTGTVLAPRPVPQAQPARAPVPAQSPGVTPKAQAEINATRAADKPSATAALGDATNNLDRLAKEVQSIMDDPALSRITGMVGVIPNAPGSAATNVAAKLEAVKSQVAFAVLQSMRNASKTGGALGSVSNFEEQMLQNNLAAVTNTKQSHQSMKDNLQKIIDYTAAAKGRLSKAYRDTYGEDAPAIDPNSGAEVKAGTGKSGAQTIQWDALPDK